MIQFGHYVHADRDECHLYLCSVTCTFAVSVKEKNMKENIKSVTENCVPVLKFSLWGDWGLRILAVPSILKNISPSASRVDSSTLEAEGEMFFRMLGTTFPVTASHPRRMESLKTVPLPMKLSSVQNSSLVDVDKGYTVTVKSKCAMWNFFLRFYNIDTA